MCLQIRTRKYASRKRIFVKVQPDDLLFDADRSNPTPKHQTAFNASCFSCALHASIPSTHLQYSSLSRRILPTLAILPGSRALAPPYPVDHPPACLPPLYSKWASGRWFFRHRHLRKLCCSGCSVSSIYAVHSLSPYNNDSTLRATASCSYRRNVSTTSSPVSRRCAMHSCAATEFRTCWTRALSQGLSAP